MEGFKNFEDTDEAPESDRPRLARPSSESQHEVGTGKLVLGSWALFLIFAVIQLSLSVTLWGPDYYAGECGIIDSKEDFQRAYVDYGCWDAADKRAAFPTLRKCIDNYCYNFRHYSTTFSNDIIFGQCTAIPLGISSGTLGLAACLAALLFITGHPNRTMRVLFSTVLLVAVFGCSICCSIWSFYHFGIQGQPDPAEHNPGTGSAHGNEDSPDFDFTGDCHYTYTDSQGTYKAMSAISIIQCIVTIVVAAVEIQVYRLVVSGRAGESQRAFEHAGLSESLF